LESLTPLLCVEDTAWLEEFARRGRPWPAGFRRTSDGSFVKCPVDAEAASVERGERVSDNATGSPHGGEATADRCVAPALATQPGQGESGVAWRGPQRSIIAPEKVETAAIVVFPTGGGGQKVLNTPRNRFRNPRRLLPYIKYISILLKFRAVLSQSLKARSKANLEVKVLPSGIVVGVLNTFCPLLYLS